MFLEMPAEVFAMAFGTEWFIDRDAPGELHDGFLLALNVRRPAFCRHRSPDAPSFAERGVVTRLYLVPSRTCVGGVWNVDPDPGLDELGAQQAAEVAERLAVLGPLAVITSPLRRCRESSVPLATKWSATAVVEPGVRRDPFTGGRGDDRPDRVVCARRWGGTWTALGSRYTDFRDGVAATLASCSQDTVVFSHFIAINAAIGAATSDDRVVIRSLDNCSVTVVDAANGALRLVEGGHEADTLIR